MLDSLLIRNIALFEEASIQFSAGLHVLTGETGAGKSLVVDAVNILCGARADRDMIRTGADTAYVEGIFYIENQVDLLTLLENQSIQLEEGQLILSREVQRKGRSVYRVNGMAVALTFYQQLTSRLIDLHGQHEHQSLLHDNQHLRYLDLLGDQQHSALLQETKAAYNAYILAKKEYEAARKSSASRFERLEILSLRQKELKDAKLVPGEEESLQSEKTMLRNAERITSTIYEVNRTLFDASNQDTAGSLLLLAQTAMERIEPFHSAFEGIKGRLTSLYYELEEISHDLNTQLREVIHDDARLEEVEQRLDLLRKLERKYGPSIDEMLSYLAHVEDELVQLENLDESLEQLARSQEEHEKAFIKLAEDLSASRSKLAVIFEKRIEKELKDLNMSSTRFYIQVLKNPKLIHAEGFDQVRMLIAPNIGEELKPLSKIASGGELSRVMLAMKTLTAEKNEVPTMVFDEIDTGVSGSTAMTIAQKLCDIGRYRQVICVTHLHQLAAMANTQYHVSKKEDGGRTRAFVSSLNQTQRTEEIAKMLGDIETQGRSSLQHATVLLEDAAQYRLKRQ